MTHDLKTWPKYYQEIVNRVKRFEFRKNDRKFKAKDILTLREWDPATKNYTGEHMSVCVDYILPVEICYDPVTQELQDFVIMSFCYIVDKHNSYLDLKDALQFYANAENYKESIIMNTDMASVIELDNGITAKTLSTEQVKMIQRHLALVFKHEIDPSYGGNQEELQAIHDGIFPLPTNNPHKPEIFYKC